MKCIRSDPVVTCNECGMMYKNGTCLFEICPDSSLEYCPTCPKLIKINRDGLDYCSLDPATLDYRQTGEEPTEPLHARENAPAHKIPQEAA